MKNTEPIDKAGAWHRLNREDRLDAFNTRREQIRSELKAKGTKRKQAAHEAWRLALDEFPPLPVEETPADDQDEDEDAVEWWQKYPEEKMRPVPPYENNDVLWAYHHMVRKSTQASDAPSRGAWGLLQ